MKIIGVTGTKDSGKTTLVTRLVKELGKRGYRVGTLKHSHVSFDFPGKDTSKHKEAGAKIIIGAGKETFFLIPNEKGLDNMLSLIPFIEDVDFLVIEGFKNLEFANISTSIENEFTIKKVDPFTIKDDEIQELIQLIEDRSYGPLLDLNCKKCGFESCREFARMKIRGLADEINCKSQFKRAMVRVNNQPIPLNSFVQRFLSKTILAMVKALEREPAKIERIDLIVKDEGEN